MAQITVPIKIDFSVVLLNVLSGLEIEEGDAMYQQGFYDCRDKMMSAIERFIEENSDKRNSP